MKRWLGARLFAAVAVFSTGCGDGDEPRVGYPEGPYRFLLQLDPSPPRAGEETSLTFRLRHGDTGEPVQGLDVVHERVIHNFIVARDFEHFAHIHHEDFRPLTDRDLARATFRFPYEFPDVGHYRIVSQFTYQGRTWTKHFDIAVGDDPPPPAPRVNLDREQTVGPYRGRLRVSPDPPAAGQPVEMVLHLSRNGQPVENLEMYLGSEVHGAIWRLDGRHFGHVHTFTPRMAALLEGVGQDATADQRAARRRAMMREMARSEREQDYQGPRIPVRHVFPEPGVYKIFLQCAPGGQPRVFEFMLRVSPSQTDTARATESRSMARPAPRTEDRR